MHEKTCTRCKEVKTVGSFGANKSKADGFNIYCYECRHKIDMIIKCRKRARAKSIPCDINAVDIHIPDNCPVCACRLMAGAGKVTDTSPSIDMYNPKLGYVSDNVWIICFACNRRKGDMSGEDHVTFGLKLIDAFGGELCLHGMPRS